MTAGKLEEILARDGKIVYRFRGTSMKPMLDQNRDLVILETVSRPLKPYDVVLYRRSSDHVLHRIIGRDSRGYVIRGDNTYRKEYGITDADIVAVMTGFVHHGKTVQTDSLSYRVYARLWNYLYPLRVPAVKVYRHMKRMMHNG